MGVSGLNCTIPNGTVAPGKVLPPAPPPTGLGELLSSVPMNGLTCGVRSGSAAAWAAAGTERGRGGEQDRRGEGTEHEEPSLRGDNDVKSRAS
ncbi:hypothetical protein GCM10020358_65050 [Amorphoplanes nipponensis]